MPGFREGFSAVFRILALFAPLFLSSRQREFSHYLNYTILYCILNKYLHYNDFIAYVHFNNILNWWSIRNIFPLTFFPSRNSYDFLNFGTFSDPIIWSAMIFPKYSELPTMNSKEGYFRGCPQLLQEKRYGLWSVI